VLCAQVINAWLKTLVERIQENYIFTGCDEEVGNMCADIPGTACN
jgi:hypothetical protein